MTPLEAPSYKVLARKYRPQSFQDLKGQSQLVQVLTTAIDTNRFPHAILLVGTRGVGKTTTARLIARCLNCVGPEGQGTQTSTPCGVCQHCQEILADHHLDVVEMDAASRTSVEDIRTLLDGIQYKPVTARYKIHIIDEVHMLSKHAFNALLKTLEEPPPHVKFIFATTEAHRIPDTIISRCMRFDLKPFTLADLDDLITHVCQQEEVTIETEAAHFLAKAAQGSARDVLSLLERAMALAPQGSHRAITGEHVRQMLGLASHQDIVGLLDPLFTGNIPTLLHTFQSMIAQGANPIQVLADLTHAIYLCTLLKVGMTLTEDPLFMPEDYPALTQTAERASLPLLHRLWQTAQKGLQDVHLVPLTHEACVMVLIRMAYLSDLPLIKDLLAHQPHPSPRPVPQARPITNATPLPQAANHAGPVVEATKPDVVTFQDLLTLCETAREPLLRGFLYHDVQLIAFDPTDARLTFSVVPGADMGLVPKLKKLMDQQTGRSWHLERQPTATTLSLAQQDAAAQQALLAAARENPAVKEVLASFPEAEIQQVEILQKAS